MLVQMYQIFFSLCLLHTIFSFLLGTASTFSAFNCMYFKKLESVYHCTCLGPPILIHAEEHVHTHHLHTPTASYDGTFFLFLRRLIGRKWATNKLLFLFQVVNVAEISFRHFSALARPSFVAITFLISRVLASLNSAITVATLFFPLSFLHQIRFDNTYFDYNCT